MTTTPTSGAADLPEALRIAAALEYCDANVAREAINELRRLHALTAQDPSQPGGFSSGDMASAAAQGFRDGLAAAQADSAEPAVHVQNPAENEHVAGDVSKNGVGSNMGAAYAELPTSSHAGRVYEEGFLIGTCPLYTADKMRAFADATHALRESHGQAPAGAARADSVQEDAARLDWLALAGPTSICVVIDRPNDGEVEVATDDVTGYGKTLREALDAARKQGGQHGTNT